MKKIIFPILMILFVIGGAVAADLLKSSSSANAAESADNHKKKVAKKATKTGDHGSDKDAKGKKPKERKSKAHAKEKGGHGKDTADSGDVEYLSFKRQFVVPVMTHGKIEALVIMNLSLELKPGERDNAYNLEPRFRDAITRELLDMSNTGVFGANLTSAENYETLRSTLLTATKVILPDGIQDILILDIARQEQ